MLLKLAFTKTQKLKDGRVVIFSLGKALILFLFSTHVLKALKEKTKLDEPAVSDTVVKNTIITSGY